MIPEDLMTNLERTEEILNYSFSDKELLLHAITHPSALEDTRLTESYERLEYLGDSYLGAIVAELLYLKFPQLDEGAMTRMRIAMVSGETLSAKAEELGLADLIIVGSAERGTGRRGMHSALENAFEALVAALVLDGGIDLAKRWVIDVLSDTISEALAERPENPKSQLQELLQARQITPTYDLLSTSGPAHDRTFTAQVLANGKVLAKGQGRSIKEAEVQAATIALQKFSEE